MRRETTGSFVEDAAKVEQRIEDYVLEETDGVAVEVSRDLHPRSAHIVVLRFELEGAEHVRYADFNAGPDKPFPCFTREDPRPLHG